MGFQCPKCDAQESLAIISRLEMPLDARSDEISLQIVKCKGCNFEAVAIYEVSHQNSFKKFRVR